ncbi:RNA polymerase sigma factor [Candidatus Acetothermia bacterium]|nr:RNA polymerase sigma factor [Candidatus Acetothermia bacterium]
MDGLIERVAKGDRSAWAELYERHKREVLALCYGILRNKDDATDAAEEAFLKVFQNSASLNPNGNARAWLLTIAANTCKDKLRKEKNKQAWLQRWKVAVKPRWKRHPVEHTVAEEFLGETVRTALFDLPDKYRIPLILRYYTDMDYTQIAETLSEFEGESLTAATVGSRINRAKEQLKDILLEKGAFEDERAQLDASDPTGTRPHRSHDLT